jgi:hypothetical protein
MLLPRRLRATMACAATLTAVAVLSPAAMAASGDLPDLAQSAPTNVSGGYFDDHSIGGDDHLGWGYGTSDPESLAIRLQSTVHDTGPGALGLCGFAAGGGWMRAFQVTGDTAACPATAPASGQRGWFRYATANHSSTGMFNRWHAMDMQRFALVPLPAAQGGPGAGTPTFWDTDWGTCLNDNEYMDCESSPSASTATVAVAPGATKITQEGAPDQAVIAIPAGVRDQLPDGRYQVVAIANPYGILRESGVGYGSVNCTTVDVSGAAGYSAFAVSQSATQPATCLLPTQLPPALTGPGGTDPFRGAQALTCASLVSATGHCWATVPTTSTPLAPHPAARTNATGTPTPTVTTSVARGAAVSVPVPDPAPVTKPLPLPKLTKSAATSDARTALGREYGATAAAGKVSCVLTGGASAECAVSWKTRKVTFSGTVHVWLTSTTTRVSWEYDMDIRQSGRAGTVHSAGVGGTVA